MTAFSRLTAILTLTMLLSLLSACGSAPVKQESETKSVLTLENVEVYIAKRDGFTANEIAARQITAADFLLSKDKLDRAHQVIDSVDTSQLAPADEAHYLLVKAKVALREGEPYIAQRFLFNSRADQIDPETDSDIAIAFYDLRAQLKFDQGNFIESVNERLKLSPYLQEDELSLQLSHDLIWEALAEIPTDTLYDKAKTERNPIKEGWYSLAALSKSNGANFRQQIVDIEKWQQIWPDHPANKLLPADLQLILQLADQQALNIAVLLPLSGNVGSFGNAIREGIMAAYYSDVSAQNITPSIQFYDTTDQDINTVFDQALARGAELVIGPLSKENVATITKREYLPVPVLALNLYDDEAADSAAILKEPTETGAPDIQESKQASDDKGINIFAKLSTPKDIFYFSLAIESEAEQVAQRAWRDGHRRALIIAPSSTWGDRGSEAFSQAWLELGGELVDDKRYKDQRSFSSLVEDAVGVDESKTRKRELQRLLGSKLEFEPRRRKDIDFVFMLAYPSQARQFLPLLAYHYASDIPVYSTGHAYSEDRNNNLSDLNGLRFSSMPWYFESTLEERRAIQAFGDNLAAFQSLYAMGIDAYHIYPRLEQLKLIRQAQFYGTTGKLRVATGNVIERTQNWAEIKRGIAVELKSNSELESDI